MTERVIVVGAGLAGATTAISLRQQGFSGSVLLLGEEPHLPYERPALSKGYLKGEVSRDSLLVQPAASYAELDIDVHVDTRVTGVDVDRHLVTVSEAGPMPYDALVVATGSTNLRPPLPGMDLAGVHQLRTLDDADRLARDAESASTVVVVGMGFVGCEVAATLRARGLDVTMVDRLSGPLVAQVGPAVSRRVRAWHEAHGVHVVPDSAVAALEGTAGVERVRLADGRTLPADLVVVGVGAHPTTDFLAETPIHLVRGAVGVDCSGRASAQDVYAAGDVAAVWDDAGRQHVRTEHYRAAIDQGIRVAHAVMGLPPPQQKPPWFWSDQYDHVLHVAGDPAGAVLHERAEPYTAFFTVGSTLSAVAAIDDGRGFRRALRLLGSEVDPQQLIGA